MTLTLAFLFMMNLLASFQGQVTASNEATQAFSPFANPHDSLIKRQSGGYYPGSTPCGSGDTCQIACGSTYDKCSSNDGELHCYQPDLGQHCCNDGSGLACDKDYQCTFDVDKVTYCCPDNLDLKACAASYGVSALFTLSSTKTTSTIHPLTTSAPVAPSSNITTPAYSITPVPSTVATGSPNGTVNATPSPSLFQGGGVSGYEMSSLGAVVSSLVFVLAAFMAMML